MLLEIDVQLETLAFWDRTEDEGPTTLVELFQTDKIEVTRRRLVALSDDVSARINYHVGVFKQSMEAVRCLNSGFGASKAEVIVLLEADAQSRP